MTLLIFHCCNMREVIFDVMINNFIFQDKRLDMIHARYDTTGYTHDSTGFTQQEIGLTHKRKGKTDCMINGNTKLTIKIKPFHAQIINEMLKAGQTQNHHQIHEKLLLKNNSVRCNMYPWLKIYFQMLRHFFACH